MQPDPLAEAVPVEEIARFPLPGMSVPGAFAFRPDDGLLTCLYSPDKSLTNLLYAFDLDPGALQPLAKGLARVLVSEGDQRAGAVLGRHRLKAEAGQFVDQTS